MSIRAVKSGPGIRTLAVLLAASLGTPAGGKPAVVYEDPPFQPSEAEADWRWLGVLPAGAACPVAASGWTSGPLFGTGAVSLWPDLGRFCLYQFHQQGVRPPALGLDPMDFEDLGKDRMALVKAGDVADETWQDLAAHFDVHAGYAGALPPGGNVRLVIVDTSPTTGFGVGQESSAHGVTLRHMAERLLCSGGSCPGLEIRSRLALAYNDFEPDQMVSSRDETHGGSFGFISELAVAIVDELLDWVPLAGAGDRLILNLSVAWDPVFQLDGLADDPPDQWPPDARSVYRALQAAACHGAIAVAASGNRSDRRTPFDGAMYPARWAFDAAPQGDPDCPAGWGAGVPVPLIVAAGGVDSAGRPLANARPESAPALAAYGDHAVVEGPGAAPPPGKAGKPTAFLTGSSVAALVVSSTFAAVSRYRPDLPADELLSIVYAAGELLPEDDGAPREISSCWPPGGLPRDCQLGVSSPYVRYVSLCRSVALACQSPEDGLCPASPLPACSPRPLGPPGLSADLSAFVATTTVDAADLTEPFDPQSGVCALEGVGYWPLSHPDFAPADPCPDLQRYGYSRRPWNGPQPNDDACPSCKICKVEKPQQVASRRPAGGGPPGKSAPSYEGVLYLEIEPQYLGSLRDPTLTLRCGGATSVYSLCPSPGPGTCSPLAPGDTLKVTGLPPDCASAWLSYTVTVGGEATSVTTPVLIAH